MTPVSEGDCEIFYNGPVQPSCAGLLSSSAGYDGHVGHTNQSKLQIDKRSLEYEYSENTALWNTSTVKRQHMKSSTYVWV